MIRELHYCRGRLFNRPLLLAPDAADHLAFALAAVMRARGLPGDFAPEEPAPPDAEPQRPRGYRIEHGVATVPVRGVLVRRAGQVDAQSTPIQSYEGLLRTVAAVRSDPRVRGVLLDIDSPGGEAGGVFELARKVRELTRDKPVWSVANDAALSAAYAIGAAGQQLWINEDGAAGSVGAVALHLDQSSYDEKAGFKYEYIARGARKTDGNPHQPLSATGRQTIQDEVERLYDKLIGNIAGHRDITADRLRRSESGIYTGENAVREGFADHVGTLEQAHAALADRITPGGARRTQSPPQEARMTTEQQPEPRIEDQGPSGDNGPIRATATDNVVRLEDLTAAVNARVTHAREVAALCNLAGFPELIEGAIGAHTSLDALRTQLQERQAVDSSRRQVEAIDPTTQRQRSGHTELRTVTDARFRAQSETVR